MAAVTDDAPVVDGLDFYNYRTDGTELRNVRYEITRAGVTTSHATLAGHVRNGDAVKALFVVPPGQGGVLSLVSYRAPKDAFGAAGLHGQRPYDVATRAFGPGEHSLTVDVPADGYF